ncbi:hypothetical protein ACV35Z_15990, partial [Pseudomonas aeruginosa]|uniref:hypothetical protein n=1 Tax=Pseudomonas aeruginosa TaxID=287 RepID=UPI001ED9C089
MVVDLGNGYRGRLVQRDLFGGGWFKAADPVVPDLQLDGEDHRGPGCGVLGGKLRCVMTIPRRVLVLIECNSFYCSCERICQPELKRRPVVVPSNNDLRGG